LRLHLRHNTRSAATPVKRPCAQCGRDRGRGHKWCAGCQQEAKREYNADYHRRHYRRLSPTAPGVVRREVARRREERVSLNRAVFLENLAALPLHGLPESSGRKK
jgi:hypothetical protein